MSDHEEDKDSLTIESRSGRTIPVLNSVEVYKDLFFNEDLEQDPDSKPNGAFEDVRIFGADSSEYSKHASETNVNLQSPPKVGRNKVEKNKRILDRKSVRKNIHQKKSSNLQASNDTSCKKCLIQ